MQFELAREYGFPSWRAMKSFVEAAAEVPVITLAGDDLCSAANRKDIVRVRQLLQQREKPTQQELDLALARAICSQGRADQAALCFALGDLLLEAGANPNGQYGGGYGPIVFAVCEGQDVAALEYLLEHGADVSFEPIATKYGLQSPISHAAFTYVRGRNEQRHRILELLVRNGAAYRDDVFFAILCGSVEKLSPFLDADPSLLDQRFPELMGIGNPDLGGTTLLHFAIEFGEQTCMDLLLDRGADLNAVADSLVAQTPVFHAIRSWRGAHYRLLRHLLEREGARIDWKHQALLSAEEGQPARLVTPMEYAGCQAREVRLLQKHGAPPALDVRNPELSEEVREAFDNASLAGAIDTVHTLLHQHPELISGYPLDWVGRRCVWHRPQMAEIARLMTGHGASAELPVLARCGLLEEVIAQLEDEPFLRDQPDSRGRTALYRAVCVYGIFPEGETVADELLKQGAQLDIWSACTLGDLEAVRKILFENPAAANTPDPHGMSPLHWACRHRRNPQNAPEIVKLLCEHGADPEAANPMEEGMRPLHHCGEWASTPEVVNALLEAGALINSPAENGWTPLDYAIDRGRHGMAAFLTQRGGIRHASHDERGRKFLKLILEDNGEGEFEEIRKMLEESAELLNAPAPHPLWGGRPQALHVSIERGSKPLFDWLLEQGADINGLGAHYDGWSPLLLALYHRRKEMVAALLERGAYVGLPEASLMGDQERVRQLLESDPDLIHAAMPSLASPLRFSGTPEIAKRLLDLGAPLEKRDRYGKTSLEAIAASAAKGPDDIVPLLRFLIETGAKTPAWVFAGVGDLARFQAAARFQPEIIHDPQSAFSAIAGGQTSVMLWMLAQGLPPDLRNEETSGATLLHAAAWEGNLALVRKLVTDGADINALDQEHHATPAQWAETALTKLGRLPCREVKEWLDSRSAN